MTFKESDALTAGQSITTVETPWGVLGVGICYDMRFPELALLMRKRGAKILVYPGAFNMTTVSPQCKWACACSYLTGSRLSANCFL